MTSKPKCCPSCGQENRCQSESFQANPPFKCWCELVTVPEAVLAKIKQAGYPGQCLCRQCLDVMIAEAQNR